MVFVVEILSFPISGFFCRRWSLLERIDELRGNKSDCFILWYKIGKKYALNCSLEPFVQQINFNAIILIAVPALHTMQF